MKERFPSACLVRFGGLLVYQLPPPVVLSQTRTVPTIRWLQPSAGQSVSGLPGGLLKCSYGKTNDCRSAECRHGVLRSVQVAPAAVQLFVHMLICPLLLP